MYSPAKLNSAKTTLIWRFSDSEIFSLKFYSSINCVIYMASTINDTDDIRTEEISVFARLIGRSDSGQDPC